MFGGTGLYIDSLIYEIEYPNIEFDEERYASFSEEERMHRTSTVGSILNGVIMVGWLGFFLMGV